MAQTIYLDYQSTTPCDPRVVDAMMPYFSENFANPASQHLAGRRASESVEQARHQIASLISASATEIIFTGGSTESTNLALLGVARAHRGNRRKIVTLATEHKAILNAAYQLVREGFEIVVLRVDSRGHIDLEMLESCLDDQTLLVSVHLANNEVGTIQPLATIADMAHQHGALVHSDATQAVGMIPVSLDDLGVDLMSLSAHKMYGPKGVGALFVRGGQRSIPLSPIGFGGGQEWSLRSGTHNVPGIVGFGEAARIASEELEQEMIFIRGLRDSLEQTLLERIAGLEVNGDLAHRLPGNSSLWFPGADAEALIANVPNLMLSTGAACNSGAPEPSYVLLALGFSYERAYSTIRAGIGRFNTIEEIRAASQLIIDAYSRVTAIANRATG